MKGELHPAKNYERRGLRHLVCTFLHTDYCFELIDLFSGVKINRGGYLINCSRDSGKYILLYRDTAKRRRGKKGEARWPSSPVGGLLCFESV